MTGRVNDGFCYRSQIGPREAGVTLLAFLARAYAHSTRAEWEARLAAGEVLLDGARAHGAEVLRPGQDLTWNRPPWLEPEVPLTFEVLHEDAAVLIVSKPSGLPTAPAGGFLRHTLLALVRARDPDWSPMHRLGRGTSGLVVFARTGPARAALQAAFRTRAVEKAYLALAQGTLSPQRLTARIGLVPHQRLGEVFAAVPAPAGRASESVVVRTEARGADTLAQIDLVTGRPHQIRIHLASAGHPLVGDPLYTVGGVPFGQAPALPGEGGYLLHAWRVAFDHPSTGRRLEVLAPAPPGLR